MDKDSSRRVLIFSPHPDDAELSMGGAIARLVDEGWEVILADMTNGEPTPAGSVQIRAAEAKKAGEILGVNKRLCLDLPNRYVENTLANRRVVAETIREYRPRWLFTAALPDAHPDHIHTNELVVDARFEAKLTKTDMPFEPHYPKKIIYFFASHLRQHIQPSFVLDISQQWQRKIEAVRAYASQFALNQNEPAPKDWIVDHLASICQYFGLRIGVEYAEPFFCHELVGLSSLASLM